MMGTVRARVREVVRDGDRVVVQAVDDAGREYAVEVPGDVAASPACSTCGPTCGCTPCRLRHGDAGGGDHGHDHDHREALVLVLAWSLHTLPGVVEAPRAALLVAPGATPPTPASADPTSTRPLDPAEVDAAFMELMACLSPATSSGPPSSTAASTTTSTSPSVIDPLDELLGLLPGPRL